MSEEQQWLFISVVDQQQYGPYSAEQLQQFAAEGAVTPETFLWTDGLDDWIPASQVEGLFPEEAPPPRRPKLLTGEAAQAARPLGTTGPVYAQAAPVTAHPVAQAYPVAAPAGSQAVPVANPYSSPVAGLGFGPQAVPPGELYPPPGTMSASFGWLLTLAGLSIACVIAAGAVAWARISAASSGASPSIESFAQALADSVVIIGGGIFLAALCLLIYKILSLIYLYRAWKAIQAGRARTSPGKAVGFLFIPFFNLYWLFIAYQGLAQDWNRVMASHPNLTYAPRLSPGLAMSYCIVAVVFLVFSFIDSELMVNENGPTPLGILVVGLLISRWILELILYGGICRGIRFMGNLHLAQLQQAAGGLRLY